MRHKTNSKSVRKSTSRPPGRQHRIARGDSDPPGLEDIIESILAEYGSPARLLELYYLSRELGGLEIIRSLMAIPEEGRAVLWSFLVYAPNPRSISVEFDSWGRVMLSSPEMVEAISGKRKTTSRLC